jgi:hypothetical protein
MEQFDDLLPERKFDNFQFVNFTQISKRAAAQGYTAARWEVRTDGDFVIVDSDGRPHLQSRINGF